MQLKQTARLSYITRPGDDAKTTIQLIEFSHSSEQQKGVSRIVPSIYLISICDIEKSELIHPSFSGSRKIHIKLTWKRNSIYGCYFLSQFRSICSRSHIEASREQIKYTFKLIIRSCYTMLKSGVRNQFLASSENRGNVGVQKSDGSS